MQTQALFSLTSSASQTPVHAEFLLWGKVLVQAVGVWLSKASHAKASHASTCRGVLSSCNHAGMTGSSTIL